MLYDMTASTVSIVVFDLGEVMIRLARGWENACREAGVVYRPFPDTEEFRARLDALEREYGCGAISPEAYFTRLRELVGESYALDELRALHNGVIREEFPGIPETVRALKDVGVQTACLSNTCASHWAELTNPARYPGIGQLDHQHASHLLGLMKPDPRIYRRFEEETGFHGGQILFFDDLAANIAAACDAGWHGVRIADELPVVEQIRRALDEYGVMAGLPNGKTCRNLL